MHDMSIASQILGLKKREFSSVELTLHYLGRIKRLNPIFNALITVTEEQALESAKRADETLSGNIYNELCGIPVVHKDIFCTRGVKTSCGSKMLHNFVPPYGCFYGKSAAAVAAPAVAAVCILVSLSRGLFCWRCR